MTQTLASRHALTFIFITMLVDTIGLGIILPIAPQLIEELTGGGLSDAARWSGWLFFVYALMQFLFAPIIGNLSDRFGRRPVLILSLLALGIDYILTGLAPTIGWLFVARILSGAAGAAYPTVNAYIADVSPPEKRAANFGLVGAAFGLGFIIGPGVGGILGEYFGPRVPFFVAGALALLNAAYGYFVLAESLPPEKRRAFEIKRANPVGALLALKATPVLFGLMGVVVLVRLAHDANPSTWTYYVMEKFSWSPAQAGYSLMAVGLCTSIVFGVLTRIIVPRIGERRAIFLGFSCATFGYVVWAFAPAGWILYAVMPIWALAGVAMPALNAIMSKAVGPSEQGALQGAVASVGSVTTIAAPLLMTGLFAYFTSDSAPIYFAGASFLAAAIFELAALGIFARTHVTGPNKGPDQA